MPVKDPPIRAALLDGNSLNRTWQRWLQSIPDYLSSSESIPYEIYIFSSTSSRDAFFNSNPDKLVKDIIIAVGTLLPSFKFQQWDGSSWVDIIPTNTDAIRIKGVDIDDSDIADARVLAYNSTTKNLKYVDVDAVKIKGIAIDSTDLAANRVLAFDTTSGKLVYVDVNAVKIKDVPINDTAIADGAALLYNSANSDLEYALVLTRDVDNNISVNNVTLNNGATLQSAMNGDLILSCDPSTASTSAATLNAAPAGTFTKTITIKLADSSANLHKWCNITLSATSSVTSADTDILAPTLSTVTPQLSEGTVDIVLTYDTDAGATKTYSAGDQIKLTVSAPNILGYTIADATFIDTLV